MLTLAETLLQNIADNIIVLRGLNAKASTLGNTEKQEVIRRFTSVGDAVNSLPDDFCLDYGSSANWGEMSSWVDVSQCFPNGYDIARFNDNFSILESAESEIARHSHSSRDIQKTILENGHNVENKYYFRMTNIIQWLSPILWLTGFILALRFGFHQTQLAEISRWELIPMSFLFIPAIIIVISMTKIPDPLLIYAKNAEAYNTFTEFYDYSKDAIEVNMKTIQTEITEILRVRKLSLYLYWLSLSAYIVCVIIFTVTL